MVRVDGDGAQMLDLDGCVCQCQGFTYLYCIRILPLEIALGTTDNSFLRLIRLLHMMIFN